MTIETVYDAAVLLLALFVVGGSFPARGRLFGVPLWEARDTIIHNGPKAAACFARGIAQIHVRVRKIFSRTAGRIRSVIL